MSEQKLTLLGKAGAIEAILSQPEQSLTDRLAIVCHPHSLQGGTMHNKVVTTLVRTFNNLAVPALRFNFRGVGNSEGDYDDGIGESEDLIAVADWAKTNYQLEQIWLAGFSFGAYVSWRAAQQLQPAGLISIAPPVNHYPFESETSLTCPWWVVMGEQDEVVAYDEVAAWQSQLKEQPTFIPFADTGHFFHGKLIALRETLTSAIQKQL